MSTLRREQFRSGSIDWLRFIIRRARRLLPLLWLTILICLVPAYWLLPPFGEFQQFCKSAIAALGLSANFYFWRIGGSYFNPGMEQLPLMHLWSLAVEEQFYLLMPAAFLLTRWRHSGGITRLAIWLTIASFILALWGSYAHPTATFYMPITRTWEFGAGALAALLPRTNNYRGWLNTLLLAALLLSFSLLDPDSRFQPLLAGLTAAATALLMYLTPTDASRSHTTRLLQLRGLQWIGQRSYAWYLLHWPAVVFYRRYWVEDVSEWELLAVSMFSLLLAALAHRFIEVPCRYSRLGIMETRFRQLSLASLTTLSIAVAVSFLGMQAVERQLQPFWQARNIFPEWGVAAHLCLRSRYHADASSCDVQADAKGREKLVLWGDSHAYHLLQSLREVARQEDVSLRTWSMEGCPPLAKWITDRPLTDEGHTPCVHFAKIASEDLLSTGKQHRTIAVLSARWEPYLGIDPISIADQLMYRKEWSDPKFVEAEQKKFTDSLLTTVRALTDDQIQVILIAPIPEQRIFIPECLSRFGPAHCRTTRKAVEEYRVTALQTLHTVAHQNPSVQIIDPINVYCDDRFCNSGSFAEPWYVDDDHLTTVGARKLQPLFHEAIAEARRRLDAAAIVSR